MWSHLLNLYELSRHSFSEWEAKGGRAGLQGAAGSTERRNRQQKELQVGEANAGVLTPACTTHCF